MLAVDLEWPRPGRWRRRARLNELLSTSPPKGVEALAGTMTAPPTLTNANTTDSATCGSDLVHVCRIARGSILAVDQDDPVVSRPTSLKRSVR